MKRIPPKTRLPFWILAWIFVNSIGCIATSEPALLISYNTQHLLSKSNGHLLSSANIVRKGESCAYAVSVFYYNTIFRGPKTSVADVAKEYGIKKIAVVDYSTFSFLGPIFYKNCIVVWGE
ncbi:TRL domain-containing protein [Leptospira ellisii]|uniref:TRL domain-containing protein n=1 Tax=Leptospira ellisii TaxID=2023197 RepID=A0A2N0BDA7_9LEPT|nr:TRL domain-containing protein [Leptospira ellisii]MDV6236503.1 TRL domain-containing protein [Leptospira ellisii]PJZ94542.1 hypothetical protein CH379_01980 [Leptospira ellisii]PKA05812.1 hypothetical protein CH375_03120 [Leptospira ellisii]